MKLYHGGNVEVRTPEIKTLGFYRDTDNGQDFNYKVKCRRLLAENGEIQNVYRQIHGNEGKKPINRIRL